MEKEITCKVIRPVAVLSENDRGYTKQVNMVSWNGAAPKLDIRTWTPDGKCLRVIVLDDDEARQLYEALAELYVKDRITD